MKIPKTALSVLVLAGIAAIGLVSALRSHAQPPVEPQIPTPAIVQKGFDLWAKNQNASWAFDTWKVGGLLDVSPSSADITGTGASGKVNVLTRYLARLDSSLGRFKYYEVTRTQRISSSSFILYAAINFQNGVVYSRLLMFHGERDWVVQDADLSPKPELLMPWLSIDGQNYN